MKRLPEDTSRRTEAIKPVEQQNTHPLRVNAGRHRIHKVSNVNLYSALSCTTSKALTYGPRVTRGSHSFTCHPHTQHTRPYPPPHFGWYSLRLPTKGWPGWVDLGGWLHTEIDVSHRELKPVTNNANNSYNIFLRTWNWKTMTLPEYNSNPALNAAFGACPLGVSAKPLKIDGQQK